MSSQLPSQLPSPVIDQLSFTVYGYISRCPGQVYEAIVDPRQISRYFATGGAHGRMESGATVIWGFADFPGAFQVRVQEASHSRRLVIEWEGTDTVSDHGVTEVTFLFEAFNDYTRTKLTITEHGWHPTTKGTQDAFGNCMGWTSMLAALKMWLEHGVKLRDDLYK